MAAMTNRPIGDYGLLSDCHSAGLVSGEGSVDWLCFPRFDSPSVFGRLLDPDAGHWSIQPSAEWTTQRRYVEHSLVLKTEFTTATGVATLTDALVFADNARGHETGRDAPHVLARLIGVVDGEMDFVVEFCPRPEYGLVRPVVNVRDGMVVARGGADVLIVAGPPPTEVDAGVARWHLHLHKGDQMGFALQHAASYAAEPKPWSQRQVRKRLADTVKGWRSWSELHQQYEGPARTLVHHSGRVLHALTYQPTGAIIAAPTTSLPEYAGGSRNWDYRYTWIRDASFTLRALWVAACPDEADRFVRFLIETAGLAVHHDQGIQIMYGIGGEHDLTERVLGHLTGWRESKPVRIGNDAWRQHQSDVFGEFLDAVLRLHENFTPSSEVCAFLIALAEAAAAAWPEPDSGIWEARGEPRHYVYSKMMCWVALDRACQLAEWLGCTERAAVWAATAEEIRSAILDRGWNEELGSFTQTFDDDQLDASALALAITGLVPFDDPRMVSTIERIASDLAAPDGMLYRYRNDDGIDGDEGTFLLCTYWLVECLAALGQTERAFDLFERATSHANDLGLLSEEIDPRTGELLGNFPQAFSHVGLVNAAHALAQLDQPPRIAAE